MDHPHPDHPPIPTEDELRQMMDESDADMAAGRTVPVSEALALLDQAIARLEAKKAAARA
jgi:hypothetical protein